MATLMGAAMAQLMIGAGRSAFSDLRGVRRTFLGVSDAADPVAGIVHFEGVRKVLVKRRGVRR